MKLESIGIAAGIATIAVAIYTLRQVQARGTTAQAATAQRTYGVGSSFTPEQIQYQRDMADVYL